METHQFRDVGKNMVDYIGNYIDNIATRRVTPSVEPGYLRSLIPGKAPEDPEEWEKIMEDVESKIMPGVTHWQHPRFHAYFPSGNCYPSILGDMLSAGIGCIGFSWAASPALTELETIVLDWLGIAIGLPDPFLALKEGSTGGGVIQNSASECVLVSMLAARAQALKRLKRQHPFVEEGVLLSKLMAYCSKEAHSCVEKAAMICFVKLRILEPDEKASLRGKTLLMAMEEDENMGLIPFFVSTTLGTTSSCSFDNLEEIGQVCQKFSSVWMHVDAAYAGSALICPELKYLLQGIEYADSFNMNLNKWMLTNFDCSVHWVRDRIRLTSALVVNPLYLQHGYSESAIDYRHWGVPLSRRFRSLKIWFVLRSYGISGLQKYIRNHIRLAQRFEEHVVKDSRFELCNDVKLGLVCFRLKGISDEINEKFLSNINASGKLHMVPANVNNKYIIRFCVTAPNAVEDDIDYAWEVIKEYAEEILEAQSVEKADKEVQDEVSDLLERKKKETLAQKRSFFVRMVSDPKIYNPAIAKSLPSSRRHLIQQAEPSLDGHVTVEPPSSSSWISWPLAFLFQGTGDDKHASNLPIRFRHLDTKVRLKGIGQNGPSPSPSPESDNSRSPKRSPMSSRRSSPSGRS